MTSPPFWNESRLNLYAAAAFFALAGTLVFVILSAQGAAGVSGRLGGDYAAFHGAGLLIAEGRATELYDWTAQAQVQAPFFPNESNAYLKFPYPPFFALPFALLTPLGFQGSFAVYTAFLWLCLWASVVVLAPTLKTYGHLRFPLFASLVFFYPMFRSILGGQNTAISLLLLASLFRCHHDRHPWRAGLALGLLLYKPQFAVPLFGLFLLRGQWRLLFSATLTAGGLYAVAAVFCGFDWPVDWAIQVENFRVTDQELNDFQSVGLVGFAQALIGAGGPIASWLGGIATATVVVVLSALWFRSEVALPVLWALTVCGLVLMPPHLLFYDAGLLALPILLAFDHSGGALWSKVLWALGFTGLLAASLGVNPLTGLALLLAALIWHYKNRSPS